MPLPLPNLDTRRWDDLVAEAVALIPRYAPEWTDHNIHDPGITLIELLAYLVEQDIYRVNQIPDRHRLKFLQLIGFAPLPPQPATTVLALTLASGASSHSLPAGALFESDGLPFRTVQPVTVIDVAVETVLVDDGTTIKDQTRLWRDGLPFPLMGADPVPGTAFYIGFDHPLPVGETISLWLDVGREMTQPIRSDDDCGPRPPSWPCDDDNAGTALLPSSGSPPILSHHSVRLAWEVWDGADWVRLLDSEVTDPTYGLTFDGRIDLTIPAAMAETTVGESPASFFLRCRLIDGRPDIAPQLHRIWLNAAPVVQLEAARSVYPIAPGVIPAEALLPGEWNHVRVEVDADGVIIALEIDDAAPEAFVIEYDAATASDPGQLMMTWFYAGTGDDLPGQTVELIGAPVANVAVQIDGELWTERPDFDASGPNDTHYTLDAQNGVFAFGDGRRGRTPDAAILVHYDRTAASESNLKAGAGWTLANTLVNAALLGGDPSIIAADFAAIANPIPARGGSNAETLNHAAGRAAETLWAHERLVETCGRCITLDQQDVLHLKAPERATTLLDYERLAREVAGTVIARARAWAGLDPAYPGIKAVGTVTVVVVPYLPLDRPTPTNGLLDVVRRYLKHHKIVGTRLVVAGPEYVEVRVQATVRTRGQVIAAQVAADIRAALNAFLDPLTGGPNGRGWPFGRDVYRAEILQVIDNVPGVDHVLALELVAGDDDAQCGNLCVGPIALTTPGPHQIEVVNT